MGIGDERRSHLFTTQYVLAYIVLFLSLVAVVFYFRTNEIKYIALVIVLPLALAALVRPIIGISIFFCWLIIMGIIQPTGLNAFGVNILIIDILALFSLPAIIDAVFHRKERDGRLFGKPIIAIMLFMSLSIVIGLALASRWQWVSRDLRVFAYIIFIYVWSTLVIDSAEYLKRFTVVLLVATAIAGLKALLIGISGFHSPLFDPNLQAYSQRIGATDITRVRLSGADTYFVLLLPIAVSLYYTKPNKYKYLALFSTTLILIGLILSFTRTSWAAVILAILTSLLYSLIKADVRKLTRSIVLFSFIGLVILVFLTMNITGESTIGEAARSRLENLFIEGYTGDPNLVTRLEESEALLSQLGFNVFLGKGVGATFRYFIAADIPYETGWSHNGWLWVVLKGGIMGLLLIIYALYIATRNLLIAVGSGHDEVVKQMVIGYIGALIGLVVMSLGINRIASVEGAAFIGLFLGISNNYRRYLTI